jgi:hypothetical protein
MIRHFALAVGGIALNATLAGALHSQQPAKWTLTTVARTASGANTGADYEFNRIAGIVPGPNGTVFVFETRATEIRVFDANGAFVRRIGRAGSGPGEFRYLTSIGFVGDTLWTADHELKRVSLFAADGRVLATIAHEMRDAVPAASRTFYGADLWFVLTRGLAVGGAISDAEALAEGKVPATPILRLTRTGRTLDTIAWMSTAHSQMALQIGGAKLFMAQRYADSPLPVIALPLERVYVVDRSAATAARDAAFRVTAMSVMGDTVWTRRYPYVPIPIGSAARDSALSTAIKIGATTATREELRAKLYLPAFRPPIASAIAAADGSLWLRRADTPSDIDYTVIGANGTLLATLTVKRNVSIKAVSGDIAWAIETDADDVQSVVRYRIGR